MVQPQNQIRILPPGTLSIQKRQTLAPEARERMWAMVWQRKPDRDNKSGMSGGKFVSSQTEKAKRQKQKKAKTREATEWKFAVWHTNGQKCVQSSSVQKQLRNRGLFKTIKQQWSPGDLSASSLLNYKYIRAVCPYSQAEAQQDIQFSLECKWHDSRKSKCQCQCDSPLLW